MVLFVGCVIAFVFGFGVGVLLQFYTDQRDLDKKDEELRKDNELLELYFQNLGDNDTRTHKGVIDRSKRKHK